MSKSVYNTLTSCPPPSFLVLPLNHGEVHYKLCLTELKKAEEKSKALETKLKQKETELKSCVSENKCLKNNVKMRIQAEKENEKILK